MRERRVAKGRQAEIDGVAQPGAGEPQAETDALLARPALDGHLAGAHGARDLFGASPKGGTEAAFPGQGGDDAPLSRLGQQAQGSRSER